MRTNSSPRHLPFVPRYRVFHQKQICMINKNKVFVVASICFKFGSLRLYFFTFQIVIYSKMTFVVVFVTGTCSLQIAQITTKIIVRYWRNKTNVTQNLGSRWRCYISMLSWIWITTFSVTNFSSIKCLFRIAIENNFWCAVSILKENMIICGKHLRWKQSAETYIDFWFLCCLICIRGHRKCVNCRTPSKT